MDLDSLRSRHPRLIYSGYEWQIADRDLVLTFKLLLEPEISFRPQLTFKNLPPEVLARLQAPLDQQLDRLFFQLGLAEIPSYYKAACPREIVITHQGQFVPEMLEFWQDLLLQGLGEFFYQNQIDFTSDDFVTWRLEEGEGEKSPTASPSAPATNQAHILIPVGGGKDSATVLAMIEEKKLPYDVLLLAPHSPAATHIAQLMQAEGHCREIITLERRIDPQLIELNTQGYFNGHTPFSAYLAFASSTVAYLYGQQHIWLGNEQSSEEENLTYLGRKINHQYSKSFEFEQKFRHYATEHLFVDQNTSPQYRSMLRAFSELEITEKLCAYQAADPRFAKVLRLMRSCNVGQKSGTWCHNCPKCAFVFTMLSAFLDEKIVREEIFKENLFAKPELEQTLLDLAGFGDKKPFECVGTFAEVREALLLAWQRDQSGTPFLRALKQKIKSQRPFEQLASSSVLILGLGQEGLSSLRFLRSHYPDKTIAVADQKDRSQDLAEFDSARLQTYFSPDYLRNLNQYDIIIKTAGIPISTPEIQQAMAAGKQIWSNTQMFFDLCPGQIIGITGTKGKSTTSQLIYELLKSEKLDTVLLGNIGEAPLNKIIEITAQTLVVAELSCHQLAELQDSPEVSVVLDIKPEHLDYYKDFASYFQSKSAIARHQKNSDLLIYNPQLEGAAAMAKLSSGQKLTHSLTDSQATSYLQDENLHYQGEKIMPVSEIALLGPHNLYNILPAIIVAKHFGISTERIRQTIRNFRGLPHRLELVAERGGVRYIDDSIAVNPHAAIMALRSFEPDTVILLAGGYEREQDFSELIEQAKQSRVKHIIALPDTGKRLHEQAQAAGLTSTLVTDLREATMLAKKLAQAGDVVLLSPASASYNSFENYAERGATFAKLVKEAS